jgi:hypothetical protein
VHEEHRRPRDFVQDLEGVGKRTAEAAVDLIERARHPERQDVAAQLGLDAPAQGTLAASARADPADREAGDQDFVLHAEARQAQFKRLEHLQLSSILALRSLQLPRARSL